MTERRLPLALGNTGTASDADENDVIQKGANGLWHTRGLTEQVRPNIILEDFKTDHIVFSAGNEAWDERWATNATGLVGTILAFGGGAHVGMATFTNATAGAIAASYRKAFDMFEMSSFRRLACRMRISSIAAGMGFKLGLINASATPFIRVCFEPATSANWLLQTNAGFDNVDTGVPVLVNTFYNIELRHDGASNYTLSVNGSAPVSPHPDVPDLTDQVTLEWVLLSPSSGANRAHQLDYIYLVCDAPGRGF